MALSWNEIKNNALEFSNEWKDETSEDAEAKSFIDGFFKVFGVSRRRVASFELRVKKIDGKDGYIDLLWKGTILIEFKSRGKDLDKAHNQAKDYFPGLKDEELPKYILVCDFENFRLYDLDTDTKIEFKLSDLVSNVQHFGFLIGYSKKEYKEQDPVNIKAAELMGKLHDRLKDIGYEGHPLEVYLVRLLFCLFAEDTTIFNKQIFQDFIEQKTNVDGSDLAAKLQELFQVLNTPTEKRFKNIDEQLNEFPYVNGRLFDETLPIASFDSKMRQALLDCCYIDWSKISPAIFGSMFQSVMNPTERRNLGAHYTSETNILKLIKPLFLDELWQEFNVLKNNRAKLSEFHAKLGKLKFLDPACGCGNFLIITYRELRLLELEVIKTLLFVHDKMRKEVAAEADIKIEQIVKVDVDQFYGIEYEEFPARVAEVAMWLIDHQMNMLVRFEFGKYFSRLPLKKAAKIVHGDALEIEWQSLLNPVNTHTVYAQHADIFIVKEQPAHYGKVNVQAESYSVNYGIPELTNEVKFDFILGNPPFIGSKVMKQNQRDQIVKQFDNADGSGVLDYVTGWYIKAAKYIQGSQIKVAFVSTNSIVQGEQTSILWGNMIAKYNIKIHFAHRTFKWSNEAKGNAAVYCVIVGFANFDTGNKSIFEYEDIKGEAHEIKAKNINPYLVDAKDIFIGKRRNPICNVPEISFGSMPNDNGFLLLDHHQMEAFVDRNPDATAFIKPFLGSEEFINNISRWCIWLKDVDPSRFSGIKELVDRLRSVKEYRSKSTREATRKLANFPTLFGEIRQPSSTYLLVPSVSSEKRNYIPIGFLPPDTIASNLVFTIQNANLFHFGVLMSTMHMAWVKSICGRLKSDYRYSKDIVYNNFPWPENLNEKQLNAIEKAAQKVIDVRADFPNSNMADLYDPLTMPPALVKAHNELDKAVDLAYRPQPFTSEANRMVFLFELYEKYTADLFSAVKVKKQGKKNSGV